MKTMSLKTLLVLLLGLLFLLLGLALFATGLANTHGFLQRQLHAHAQETATTLALELSPALASNDTAAVANAVDALYDSGYYRRIAVIRPNGESVVERELPLKSGRRSRVVHQPRAVRRSRGSGRIDGRLETFSRSRRGQPSRFRI